MKVRHDPVHRLAQERDVARVSREVFAVQPVRDMPNYHPSSPATPLLPAHLWKLPHLGRHPLRAPEVVAGVLHGVAREHLGQDVSDGCPGRSLYMDKRDYRLVFLPLVVISWLNLGRLRFLDIPPGLAGREPEFGLERLD